MKSWRKPRESTAEEKTLTIVVSIRSFVKILVVGYLGYAVSQGDKTIY